MRFLSIQSSVAYGHVGNSAATFPLQRLGHEVWPVPTVVFSNHTGYGAWRGPLLPPDDVRAVVTGIAERGVLATCDGVLSGYLGGPGICEVVVDAVAQVKAANPAATYTCDPVMGNATSGCFVDPAIPPIIREQVVPVADIITPNQFELGFLTHTEPDDLASTLESADIARASGAVDGAGDVVPAARRPRRHDRDAGGDRRRRLERADPAAADEGERLGRPHRGAVHRPPEGDRAPRPTRSRPRSRRCTPYSTATLESGERELRIVAAQDAIAHPAREFEVEQVR